MSLDIRIERLSLRVPGLDEEAGRDLARLVAEGLAAGQFRSAPHAGPDLPPISDNPKSDNPKSDNRVSESRSAGGMSIKVAGDSSGSEVLARRIAGEILRAIEREVMS